MELTSHEKIFLLRLQQIELDAVSLLTTGMDSVPPFLRQARLATMQEDVLALAAAGMLEIEDWDSLIVTLTEQGRTFKR